MKQIQRHTYCIILVVTLLIALNLRLWGVNFGLPYVGFQPDEWAMADQGIEILRDGFSLSHLRIGTFHAYIQAGIGWFYFFLTGSEPEQTSTFREMRKVQGVSINPIGIPSPIPNYYLIGRIAVAVMGTISVGLTYLIGREMKSPRVGLLGAMFLSISPLHVEYSHYLIRTIPGLMFLLLAFYLITVAYCREKWWLYIIGSIFVALAILTKQNNLIVVVPLMLALGLSVWHKIWRKSLKEAIPVIGMGSAALLMGALTLALVLGYTTPQSFFYGVFSRIWNYSYVYNASHFGFNGENTFLWVISYLWRTSNWGGVFLLSLIGILLAVFKLDIKGGLLISTPIAYLFVVSFFTVRFLHWIIPIIPFLALFAAISLVWLSQQINYVFPRYSTIGKNLILVCILVIIFPSIKKAITDNYWFTQKDVRVVASEWLNANIPTEAKVVIEKYGPYLPATTHNVEYVKFAVQKDLRTYQANGVQYLVGNELSFLLIQSEAVNPAGDPIATEYLARYGVMFELPLVQEFTGPAMLYPDQRIRVYRVP